MFHELLDFPEKFVANLQKPFSLSAEVNTYRTAFKQLITLYEFHIRLYIISEPLYDETYFLAPLPESSVEDQLRYISDLYFSLKTVTSWVGCIFDSAVVDYYRPYAVYLFSQSRVIEGDESEMEIPYGPTKKTMVIYSDSRSIPIESENGSQKEIQYSTYFFQDTADETFFSFNMRYLMSLRGTPRLAIKTSVSREIDTVIRETKVFRVAAERIGKASKPEQDIMRDLRLALHFGVHPRRVWSAILFADIINSTSVVELSDRYPLEYFQFLGKYIASATKTVLENDGVVDKYIGDGLMAYFPSEDSMEQRLEDREPEKKVQQKVVKNAFRAAIAVAKALRILKRDYSSLQERLGIRIGIAPGYVTFVNMGQFQSMDFTVIGQVVNLASRLESFKTHEILREYQVRYEELSRGRAEYEKLSDTILKMLFLESLSSEPREPSQRGDTEAYYQVRMTSDAHILLGADLNTQVPEIIKRTAEGSDFEVKHNVFDFKPRGFDDMTTQIVIYAVRPV